MIGNKKIALLGGGGARTPLFVHGLCQSKLRPGELALYDIDHTRAQPMAKLSAEIAKDSPIRITTPQTPEEAIDGASFVISSIRVGGMEARARDERIAKELGFAGQETTGPGGLAMALRTIPVALEYARLIERYAPDAWLINFTNPAGLITQALINHSHVKVIGICDTPSELFHRIGWAVGGRVECAYSGLNHLGWVQSVLFNGREVIGELLQDNAQLSRLYPADLFDPVFLRALGLLPTEYLFFYYSASRAYHNQVAASVTRGQEIVQLNAELSRELASNEPKEALTKYKMYLNRRNASYMRLDANAESAFSQDDHDWDPFEGETGYHRIALDVLTALAGQPKNVVVNVRNGDTLSALGADDVVEVSCLIDEHGPHPSPASLPAQVQGLTLAVKEYERLAIRAALEKSVDLARLSLCVNPIVGDWERATALLQTLIKSDPVRLAYMTESFVA